MAVSYRVIFVVVIMIVIIALVNTRMYSTTTEGFDCASDAELLDTPFDTGPYIDGVFNLFESSNILKQFSNDDIKRLVAVLTNIYKTFETAEISPKRNPFYGTDLKNPPKPCGCYMTIAQNFNVYYLIPKRYQSSNQTEYFSVLRYFFDVEDSANETVYTGLGNYKGAYTENYYNEFFKAGSYTVPSEITNEPTNLMNPGFKYHLNYFSKYLLIHTQSVNKKDMMQLILKLADNVLKKYTGGTYDRNLNPYPGKKIHVTDLQKIVKKARSKTFADSNSGELCSGSKLNTNSQKTLNAITDKKYFVAYLKSVIQAIQGNTSGTTSSYQDWDPNGWIMNNNPDHDMILSDTYLLSNSVDNVYNLMEQFGHFDPLTNTYTLNTTGNLVIQQMSVDVKKCAVDYLEKMCVLAFAPIQYGGEVNYDRWGFF